MHSSLDLQKGTWTKLGYACMGTLRFLGLESRDENYHAFVEGSNGH